VLDSFISSHGIREKHNMIEGRLIYVQKQNT